MENKAFQKGLKNKESFYLIAPTAFDDQAQRRTTGQNPLKRGKNTLQRLCRFKELRTA